LFETFKNISEEVGFNIELKYPQMQVNGENECDTYFERNEFVDIILAEVLNNAGHRRIVFSSFEADICKMFVFFF
jgi:glycerophosphoryl diester phosphodiesterase